MVSLDEAKAATWKKMEYGPERDFIVTHLEDSFNIADMKKFHADRVADSLVSEAEFMNYFT